jgi:hypothetical protein
MHEAADAVSTGESQPITVAEAAAQIEANPISTEPEPVSPMGYASLAGLVGLAAGMVLAPWLEKLYHRLVKHNEEI